MRLVEVNDKYFTDAHNSAYDMSVHSYDESERPETILLLAMLYGCDILEGKDIRYMKHNTFM